MRYCPIKCASKMARRFCHFCAIQQKQPMTSFCHGLMSRCDKKDTRLHALTKFETEKNFLTNGNVNHLVQIRPVAIGASTQDSPMT